MAENVNVKVEGNGAALGTGIAALVLGILALLVSWIPLLGCFALPLAALGVILAVIGVLVAVVSGGRGIGMPIAGGVASALAVVVFFVVTGITSATIDSMAQRSLQSRVTHTQQQAQNSNEGLESVPTAASSPEVQEMPQERATSIITAEYLGQEPVEYMTRLSFRLTNASGRDVNSLAGAVHVYDQFGRHLSGMKIDIDDPFPGDTTIERSGIWPTTSERTLRLLDDGRAELKFRVNHVIYADGERESFR